MIFQCADLERALRTAELMPDARRHAERCEQCREQLFQWNEISRVAPQLHEDWESDTLWPRIREALSAEPVRHQRPRTWRWALAIAAMVTLAVALLMPPRAANLGGPELLSDGALREVQQAEAAYARSIDKLAAVAQPGMEKSGSPLAAAYREKLVLLDSAIADLKKNVEENSYNAYLRTELASLYGEKQKTLREWMDYAKSK